MANREELQIIRAARAGQASAQLSLGKRYLFGGAGLPKSLPTALYWLDRAAQQDESDAWMLIGSHVPFETVQQAAQPSKMYVWYERAFDAGVAQAGHVLAKLVLGQVPGAVSDAMRNKALRALQAAAHAGIPEAQWMLAQWMGHPDAALLHEWPSDLGVQATDNEAMLEWATRAARSGVVDAQLALAEHAWASGDHGTFLKWALPLARDILKRTKPADPQLLAHDASLVLRCARSLRHSDNFDPAELSHLLEFAAQAGDREAQLELGLWLARIDERGNRIPVAPGAANYKRAIRWLLLAAHQESGDAAYALSKIYLKPEYSHRNRKDARNFLEIAARAGHGRAQLELGMALWRARREREENDVLAVEWLQKAQAQGIIDAGRILGKIAYRAEPAPWARVILQRPPRAAVEKNPLLIARIRLAELFGLDRTEALLIDPKAADRGHCLVVDVRAQHPHSKRRLILVETVAERQALDRILAAFENVAYGPRGPEGNYRQRLYRLKSLAGE
ncbi:MAG TPA: hypothetical protein VFF81_01165 [Noviherbaspirillum sp.]|nr:hypothetical protein [Noviherbaspirillum sp.]